MGELIRWLIQDAQKDLFDLLFALVLNSFFLALLALLLWPLDQLILAFQLAKGYGVLWIVVSITTLLLKQIHRSFRVNLYDHANTYVLSNLMVSCLLQIGWSAFAVLTLHANVVSVPSWLTMFLYLGALLSCFIAFLVVSAFYQGQIYRIVNLLLAAVSFLIFSLWPASARVLYGWFFQLL